MTENLAEDSFDTWGWRVPFLVSIVLVGSGLYVRPQVMESRLLRSQKREAVLKLPVLEVIRTQPRELLTSADVRMSEQAPG